MHRLSRFHVRPPVAVLALVVTGFSLAVPVRAAAHVVQPQRARSHASVASTGGTWSYTGSMSFARANPSLTLLPNGKVLVAGGLDQSNNALASAELYDPASGLWTPTGSMASGRHDAQATLLPTGMVLVEGGQNGTSSLASAELYNPNTGTWTPTGSMHDARALHVAALLHDGRVLVAGGQQQNGVVTLTSAEVYDPSTGTWQVTGSMHTARADESANTAVPLFDGTVLVEGGESCTNCPSRIALNSPELYHPETGTWTTTGSMNVAREGHIAVTLPDGRVLVAGGNTGVCCPWPTTQSSAELYDPQTHTWTYTGSMTTSRVYGAGTVLSSGLVLVAGGKQTDSSGALASAELFNSSTGTWTATGSMLTANGFFPMVMLPNGKVLAAGGWNNGTILSSAESYTPPTTVVVNPTGGEVDQPFSVTGGGWMPGEQVTIGWDSPSVPLTTTTASATGSFVVHLSVPQAISGTHTVIASGQRSGITVSANFQVRPATYLLHATGHQGAPNAVLVTGYGYREQVTATWTPGDLMLGSARTDALGSAVISLTVPAVPTGLYTVRSVGASSRAHTHYPFLLLPLLTIVPDSGAAGSPATVSGTGYGAHEAVIVRWDCAQTTCRSTILLGAKDSDGRGNFSGLHVTIPASARSGPHAVGGKGGASNAFAATVYTVTP